jgi:transforming growth factor-beta-induced protein
MTMMSVFLMRFALVSSLLMSSAAVDTNTTTDIAKATGQQPGPYDSAIQDIVSNVNDFESTIVVPKIGTASPAVAAPVAVVNPTPSTAAPATAPTGIVPVTTAPMGAPVAVIASPTIAPAVSSNATTVVSVVTADTDLSSLAGAVTAAGLGDILSGTGPFTIFAPTNVAFTEADADGLVTKFLTLEWKAHLIALLRFHVHSGELAAANITDGMNITTLLSPPEDITAIVVGGTVMLDGLSFFNSTVVQADLEADNGVVHKVNKVFIPSSLTQSIFEAAEGFDGFSNVIGLVVQAGLEETLRNDIVTIFGPGNTAFSALPADFIASIASDAAQVKRILSNHIVNGIYYRERLTNGLELTSLAGETLTISVTEGRFPTYMVNNATIEVADVVASNGIAHIINSLLIPPAANATTTTTTGGTDSPNAATNTTNPPCSVCLPGTVLTLPNAVVTVPPGVAPEGITQVSCAIIDSAVSSNPDLVSPANCTLLRDTVQEVCGCVASSDSTAPTSPPAASTTVSSSRTTCTVCPTGQEISKPDATVVIPAGYISDNLSTASCTLLERGLAANAGNVNDTVCPTLQATYADSCGCREVSTPTTSSTGGANTTTTSSSGTIRAVLPWAWLLVGGMLPMFLLIF